MTLYDRHLPERQVTKCYLARSADGSASQVEKVFRVAAARGDAEEHLAGGWQREPAASAVLHELPHTLVARPGE